MLSKLPIDQEFLVNYVYYTVYIVSQLFVHTVRRVHCTLYAIKTPYMVMYRRTISDIWEALILYDISYSVYDIVTIHYTLYTRIFIV